MTTISVCARIGAFVSSRRSASTLRLDIVRLVESGEDVTLDFAGVQSVSDSFSDELIAVLAEQKGLDWVRAHVHFLNLLDDDRQDFGRVIGRRLHRNLTPSWTPAE